jgi:uncharacterized membrane protein
VPDLHPLVLVVDHSRDAAYDLVLLAHVLSALVGFGAVVVAGGFALVLSRSGSGTEAVQRYYRPGVNWAGRVLFLVPVLGVALVLMSGGDYSFADGWISAGLALWAVAAIGAEMALWPAERQLQVAVSEGAQPEAVRSRCRAIVAMAGAGFVVLVVATVLMVAKP